MDPRQFHSAAAGRVVRTPQGYHAFIPAPLPLTPDRQELAYDDALVLALSTADVALSELSGVGSSLPNPHLLVAP